jgi:hypothetical protein
MGKSTVKVNRVFLFAIVAAWALVGLVGPARADSYGYSVEQTSGYSVSGATLGSLSFFSSSGAFQNASPSGSESQGSTSDTLQSYVGPGAGRPAENTFTPKGMTTPSYSRGDALLGSPTLSTASVAEGFLTSAGNGNGTGAWSISAPLSLISSGAVTLSFNFSNQLSLVNTAPAGAIAADFSYDFDIQNSSGVVVFSSAPTSVNRTMSLTSLGNISQPAAGSLSITSTTLAAGSYTMTLSGASHVFINAVPEPSTYMLLVSGAMMIGGAARARRRRRS